MSYWHVAPVSQFHASVALRLCDNYVTSQRPVPRRCQLKDGFEVFQHLRADPTTAEVPVIFVTSLHDVRNESTGFEVGGVS